MLPSVFIVSTVLYLQLSSKIILYLKHFFKNFKPTKRDYFIQFKIKRYVLSN